MKLRNGGGLNVKMNMHEEVKIKPIESTTSSDSGVGLEENIENTQNENLVEIRLGPVDSKTEKDQIKDDNSSSKVRIEEENEDRLSTTSTHSECSHNISIVSLEDVVSSEIDSDVDFSDISGEFEIQKLGKYAKDSNNDGVIKICQNAGREPSCSTDCVVANKPQIGSVAVQNSTDITFGNKTTYQGPVIIKQFLLENKKWRPKEEGTDNKGYEGDGCKEAPHDKNPKTDPSSFNNGLRKKLMFNSKRVFITGAVILLSVIFCAITFTTISFTNSSNSKYNPGDGDDSRKNIPINSTIGDDNIAGGSVLRFVTRDEWIAQPPNNELTALELPSKRVIIAHTATEGCDTQAACVFRIRYIQTFHMESRNWDDIAYNFLVGGDGAVYEGRGWDKMGAHTKGYNTASICIAFVGTFIKHNAPEKQLRAAQLIIAEGVQLGKLTSDYKLFGHRQLIASESPGEALYKVIKTWPHWSDQIE